MVMSPLTTVSLVPTGTPVLDPSGKPAGEVAVAVGVGFELVVGVDESCGAVGAGGSDAGSVVDVEALGRSIGLGALVVGVVVAGAVAVGPVVVGVVVVGVVVVGVVVVEAVVVGLGVVPALLKAALATIFAPLFRITFAVTTWRPTVNFEVSNSLALPSLAVPAKSKGQ
jgi:hypothetical protein